MKKECRVCRGNTIQKGFLFKCKKKSCGAVFWHRKVLFEDLENDIVFKEQLSLAEIPQQNFTLKMNMRLIMSC